MVNISWIFYRVSKSHRWVSNFQKFPSSRPTFQRLWRFVVDLSWMQRFQVISNVSEVFEWFEGQKLARFSIRSWNSQLSLGYFSFQITLRQRSSTLAEVQAPLYSTGLPRQNTSRESTFLTNTSCSSYARNARFDAFLARLRRTPRITQS